MFEINCIYWNVIYVNPNDDNLKRSDGSITLGVTDLETKTIYINSRLHGALLQKVLLHEICHAFIFSTGYYFDIATEELICDLVASYGRDMIETLNMLIAQMNRVVI